MKAHEKLGRASNPSQISNAHKIRVEFAAADDFTRLIAQLQPVDTVRHVNVLELDRHAQTFWADNGIMGEAWRRGIALLRRKDAWQRSCLSRIGRHRFDAEMIIEEHRDNAIGSAVGGEVAQNHVALRAPLRDFHR